MGEVINRDGKVGQSISAQAAIVDEAEEAMKRFRICPRKVLGSLSHLRLDKTRIEAIGSQAPKAGGKADVEAAVLTSVPPSGSSEDQAPEYVAVKKLRFDSETDDDQALAPFAHEVSLLNCLSHNNVVKIIGFVEDAENGVAWMVFSWEKNGNLREFVQAENWELPERVSLIVDVAEGLNYLHGRNPPICHGDLKSLNILVNSANRAFITDFGSARYMDSETEAVVSEVNVAQATRIQHRAEVTSMESIKAEIGESGEFITITGPAWTLRWAAPELLEGVLPGLGSDVWAFGWICWEVITGNFPFQGENDVAVVQRILGNDLPTVSNHSQLNQIKMLCSLMEECLRLNVDERPPAPRCQQIVSWMDQIIPVRRANTLAPPPSSGLLHALGRIQLQNGQMDEAQEYFRQSLEVSQSAGDEQGKARAMHGIGGVYHLQGEYSKAVEWYSQSYDIYDRVRGSLGASQLAKAIESVNRIRYGYLKAEESYVQSGDLYCKVGYRPENTLPEDHIMRRVIQIGDVEYTYEDLSKEAGDDVVADDIKDANRMYASAELYMIINDSTAEKFYIQSGDLYSEVGDHFGVSRSANALGNLYFGWDEYTKAEESYIQSRDLCSKIGDRVGFAQSVKALGDVYQMQNEYSKAEESYIQSRDLYSTIGDQLGFAHSVKGLGDVYRSQNHYLKAKESYIQSRDLCSRLGDRLGFAHSLKSLGDVYYKRGEYSKAEECYVQSRDIYSSLENQLGFASSVRALIDLQRTMEGHRKAEGSYIESRDLTSQIENQRSLARSLDKIACRQICWRQYAKAEQSFLEARELRHQIGDTPSAKVLYDMGFLYNFRQRYAEAERMLREASTMYSELGQTEEVARCDKLLDEVVRLMGN